MRITQALMRAILIDLSNLLDKPCLDMCVVDGKFIVGSWDLEKTDHGYNIIEYTNELGGCTTPFGSNSKTPKEFMLMCYTAIYTIRILRGKKDK